MMAWRNHVMTTGTLNDNAFLNRVINDLQQNIRNGIMSINIGDSV